MPITVHCGPMFAGKTEALLAAFRAARHPLAFKPAIDTRHARDAIVTHTGDQIPATAVCTAGKTFVCSEASGDVTYLYVYETGYPIAVSFSEGENHAWSASGTFLINDRLDAASQESIASFFAEYAIEVGVVS